MRLAVTLRREADDRGVFDTVAEQIDSDAVPSEEQVQEFVDNRRYYEKMIRRMSIVNQRAYVSRIVLDDNRTVGYMSRDEPLDDQDSGWSFMAGIEDETYTDDPQNGALALVSEVCRMDPAVWKFIDAPVGSGFIRISPEEFISWEEFEGVKDRRIWLGEREQGEA